MCVRACMHAHGRACVCLMQQKFTFVELRLKLVVNL